MSSPLTDDELAAIEARAAAATPGEWHFYPADPLDRAEVFVREPLTLVAQCPRAHGHGDANAAFIARARTDVVALLAEIRRLRAGLTMLAHEVRLDGAECSRFGSGGAPMLAGIVQRYARSVLDGKEPDRG